MLRSLVILCILVAARAVTIDVDLDLKSNVKSVVEQVGGRFVVFVLGNFVYNAIVPYSIWMMCMCIIHYLDGERTGTQHLCGGGQVSGGGGHTAGDQRSDAPHAGPILVVP